MKIDKRGECFHCTEARFSFPSFLTYLVSTSTPRVLGQNQRTTSDLRLSLVERSSLTIKTKKRVLESYEVVGKRISVGTDGDPSGILTEVSEVPPLTGETNKGSLCLLPLLNYPSVRPSPCSPVPSSHSRSLRT